MNKFLLFCIALTVSSVMMAQTRSNSGTTVGSASSTGYSQSSGTNSASGQTYTSTNADENAVKITGGSFTMTDCTIKKTSGNTTSSDNSSFYGINSALYCAGSSSILTMNGGSITTSATGANSVIAYNKGTINISNVTINNTSNLSRGIHATGGGIINATNLNITTSGANSSVIATDRGGGTVTVNGGSYITTGKDCAITYSTGAITVSDATGSSSQGPVAVIEGDNSITLNNCTMTTGSVKRGMMILQSGSGDASGYNGMITINGGSITMTSSVALCEVPTNITGTLTLKDATITMPGDTLMKVDYNTRWKTYGGTGNLILSSDNSWAYSGIVYHDSYGKVNVTVKSGVTWNLTGNVNMNVLTIEKGGIVNTNGYTLTTTSTVNNGSMVTSGIEELATNDSVTHFDIYDISGVKVKTNASDLSNLKKGIYIVNGKKFIVK